MRGRGRFGLVTYGDGAGTIDLGDEPPLRIGQEDDDRKKTALHRAVSWRWMTGTVLTGVTSIFLMGAALMAALYNPNQFASLPESFAARSASGDGLVFGRKADRMHPVEERVSNRQILQVSTVTRQGERDFIKLKPFVKINATLSAADPELAAKVPPYDPLKIFADTSAPDDIVVPVAAVASNDNSADQPIYGAAVDGEVAVQVSAFPIDAPDLEPAVALSTTEVEQIVRATAHISTVGADGTDVAALPYGDPGLDPAMADAPFSALGVKIVPENVSNIAKSDAGVTLDEGYQEKIISVVRSENLRTLFEDNAITGDDADEIIAALSQLIDVSRLRPGQKIRVAFSTDPDAPQPTQEEMDADPAADPAAAKAVQRALRPIRVSIYADGAHQATVARADNNVFVRADEPSTNPEIFAAAPVEEEAPTAGPPKLYEALYQTALEQEIPTPLIDELIKVFAYDVDFQARVGAGDSLEVFHSTADPNDKEAGDPELLFASLTLGGVAKRFYRFHTGDDGVVDYYDEEGKSAKKFLMRKPMTIGIIRSGFGWRVHPILGYRRLHAGVDYAAPKGTPIMAAGNGVVEKAGKSSGYGNLTILRHTNGYETAYGHQTAFAKGLVPGATVRQGQIIGYVGSTGLSTGPHLHFEIRVNGQPVDPLRIRLQRGRVLEGNYLVAFEKERDRIDALLGNQPQPAVASQKVAAADAGLTQ